MKQGIKGMISEPDAISTLAAESAGAPPKIALVVVYFGHWPVWFPAFLTSCARNQDITWLIYNDCGPVPSCPENVQLIPFSQDAFRSIFAERVGVRLPEKLTRKLCDLKPTYGLLFEQALTPFDFWGFCDLDIVWGDIRAFVTAELLETYDVVTSRRNAVAGHFCIFRNTSYLRSVFLKHPDAKTFFSEADYCWFDENALSDLLRNLDKEGTIRVWWKQSYTNFSKQTDNKPSMLSWLDRFEWDNGKLTTTAERQPVMYCHFMNWKETLCLVDGFQDGEVKHISISYYCAMANGHRPGIFDQFRCFLQTLKEPQLYGLYFYRGFKRTFS